MGRIRFHNAMKLPHLEASPSSSGHYRAVGATERKRFWGCGVGLSLLKMPANTLCGEISVSTVLMNRERVHHVCCVPSGPINTRNLPRTHPSTQPVVPQGPHIKAADTGANFQRPGHLFGNVAPDSPTLS